MEQIFNRFNRFGTFVQTHAAAENLVGAKITDAGLQRLSQLQQLQTLRLADTRLSDVAVERLRSQLPQCQILR